MSVYVFMDEVEYDTSALTSGSETIRRLQVLGNQISEHLGCFTVYGFDHHGTPIKIGNVSSPMEQMAVSKFIEEDAMGFIGPGMPDDVSENNGGVEDL